MEKISFAEKNNFVVKHKSGKHFSKDLELFKKYFPVHRLNNDLARANSFTYDRLDGQILYDLLEKVSPKKILENRVEKPIEKPEKVVKKKATANKKTVEKAAKEKALTDKEAAEKVLEKLNQRIDTLEESNEYNEDEISALRDGLEDKDVLIEDLQSKIEALEKKAFNKKKASETNSPQ
jgi:uncharacterized coiled-coil protein SlyX